MLTQTARTAALALAIALGASTAAMAADTVVAVINGKELHRKDLEDFKASTPQLRQLPIDSIYDQLLETLINDQIITAEARKQNLQNDAQVKAKLKDLENKVIQQAYLSKQVEARVTDASVKQRYDDASAKFVPAEEVHARHILVETEEQAKQIIAELGKGGSFQDIAKAKSKDTNSGKEGGDLGFFTKEEMVPAFATAAFELKPGQVSEKPVQTQFGWHVIKVEEKRQSSIPPFEQVKDQIRSELSQETVMATIKDLRDKADVKRFSLEGQPLPSKPQPPQAQPQPAH